MKVKDAYERLKYLKRLANNARLIEQYFLQCSDGDLEEIAERHGINSPINFVMTSVVDELMTLAVKYESAMNEAEIENL